MFIVVYNNSLLFFFSLGCLDYDFIDAAGVRVKGNGYRSLLEISKQFLNLFVDWLRDCIKHSLFSYKDQYRDLESATRALNVSVFYHNEYSH